MQIAKLISGVKTITNGKAYTYEIKIKKIS